MKRVFRTSLIFSLLVIFSCNPVARYIHDGSVLQWEAEIHVLDSLNAAEIFDEETILVTGSSSVRMWDSIHVDMAPYRIIQRGYGGAKLSDYNHYAERIIKPQRFKAIVVFVANDIAGGEEDRTPREMFLLYRALVEQIRERNHGTPVFWIETTPTPSRWHVYPQAREANLRISEYCDRNADLYFTGTCDAFLNSEGMPDSLYFRQDMLHLNRDGYKHWARIIKKSLEQAGIYP